MNYDPNKNKSMGYDPIPSTGNNTGYYMGQDSNLMNMMQTGGQATRGGAAFARAKQFQRDQERLDEAAEKEGRRQKRGGLFGSIGGLLGGVAGAALAPLTGGLSIPVAAGIGSALGKGAGEFLGAGKATEVDTKGTVFAQDAFGDVEEAGRDFNQGILGRAGVAGLKTGFTAGLAPGGGIYGKLGSKVRGGLLDSGIGAYSSGVVPTDAGVVIPASAEAELLGDVAIPEFDSSLPYLSPARAEAELLGDVVVPEFDSSLTDYSNMVTQPTIDAYQDSLLDSISLGEDNRLLDAARTSLAAQRSAEGTSARMERLLDVLQNPNREPIVEVGDFLPVSNNAPVSDADFISRYLARLPRPRTNFEDGGEVQNYQYGGFTSEDVLESQGLQLSDEQKKLFQSFDPTQIQSTTQDLSQGLLGMTSGQGLSSQGGGFGAQQRNISQALDQSQQALQGQIESAQRDFESQTLGTAADLVSGGAEIEVSENIPQQPPENPGSLFEIQEGADGRMYRFTFNGWEYYSG